MKYSPRQARDKHRGKHTTKRDVFVFQLSPEAEAAEAELEALNKQYYDTPPATLLQALHRKYPSYFGVEVDDAAGDDDDEGGAVEGTDEERYQQQLEDEAVQKVAERERAAQQLQQQDKEEEEGGGP
jgi:hypothetical protein